MSSVAIPKRAKLAAPLESQILHDVRAVLGLMPDVTLFRNNCGMLRDARGGVVRYGLAVGSADLIGSLRVAADVRIARSLALEVKRPGGKLSAEQAAWLDLVRSRGWIAECVWSVEDAVSVIERARRWEL
jgi:hypothetical protein